MKKSFLTIAIAVFLLICFDSIEGQNVSTNLDQLKLAQGFVGTWQQNIGKDTIELTKCQQYGKAFIENVYLVIKGEKSFSYTDNYGFSLKQNKFRGFMLYQNGYYSTWLASFTSEKLFKGDFVRNFNPEAVIEKFEILLESPKGMTITVFDTNGVKTREYKYLKVK